ncbi:hypothetical protein AGMMS49545_02520 [Betaproteobacteria bacterium]|nr:hypothetical protein AGMMS49545_02520 [Betaproteobacteria bacterium]GHU40248.1 hypothetical protein AGMMS50289_01490 [Betaproteobacteria bacterium]
MEFIIALLVFQYIGVVILSINVVGILAQRKGQNFGGWTFCCFLFGPLAILGAWASPVNRQALEERELHTGKAKRCPACQELVRVRATLCKHCGTALEGAPDALAKEKLGEDRAAAQVRYDKSTQKVLWWFLGAIGVVLFLILFVRPHL